MKNYDNDVLFANLGDLTNQTFKAWYMKAFYALGKDEILKIASIARADGKDKRRYFSKLLKEALIKKESNGVHA